MDRNYFIDVMLRGLPPGDVEAGDEPIVAAIRLAVEAPEDMDSNHLSVAIGKQVQEIGVHLVDNYEQMARSIDNYEEAIEELLACPEDDPEIPPDSRPN